MFISGDFTYVHVYTFLLSSISIAVLGSLSSCEGHYFIYCEQPSAMSNRALCWVDSICSMGWRDGTVGFKRCLFSVYNIEKERN